MSTKQDHWGFANNNNASTLIPKDVTSIELQNLANRNTDPEKVKAGIISRITYPTGSYTDFTFEANSSNVQGSSNNPLFTNSGTSNNATSQVSNSSTQVGFKSKTTDFTITSVFGSAVIATISFKLQRNNTTDVTGRVAIINKSTNAVVYEGGASLNIVSISKYLQPGNYTIYSEVNTANETAYISVNWVTYQNSNTNTPQQDIVLVGGVRIKQISTYESSASTPIVKRYDYSDDSPTPISSGTLVSLPKYRYSYRSYVQKYQYSDPQLPSGGIHTVSVYITSEGVIVVDNFYPNFGQIDGSYQLVNEYTCGYDIINSSSKVPLGLTQGSPIYYAKVTVYNDNNGDNGKSEMYFSQKSDALNYVYPFVQHESYDFQRGLLIKQIDYKKTSTSYSEIKRLTNTYKLDRLNPNGMSGKNTFIKTGYSVVYDPLSPSSILTNASLQVKTNSHRIFAPWISLSQTSVIQDGVESVTLFNYDEAAGTQTQPIISTTTNSDGKENKIINNYQWLNRHILVLNKSDAYYNNIFVGSSQIEYKPFATTGGSVNLPFKWSLILRDNTTLVKAQVPDNGYNADGLLTNLREKGYTLDQVFTWDKNVLKQKTFGTLSWNYDYYTADFPYSRQLKMITDENGLKKKFYYDPLLRLQRLEDRMNASGGDIQATTTYQYQYRDGGSNPFNYVGTSTTFKDGTAPLSTKQYLDGLGRPIATVKENYTPVRTNDIYHTVPLNQKNYITYDALGRQDKTYQPIESNVVGVDASLSTLLADKPNMQTVYEPSPLNRPIKQIKEDGNFVYMAYGANTTSEVRRFTINTFTPTDSKIVNATTNGYYDANTLMKTCLWDENATALNAALTDFSNIFIGRTDVYKDKLGRVILTRKYVQGSSGYDKVETYNVYDDYGNLVLVIPPGGIDGSGNILFDVCFQYVFDNLNRLSCKKIPGALRQKYFYDNRDLLTLTQDGNMRAAGSDKYLGTLYDALGRVIKTGWVNTSTPETKATALIDGDIIDVLTTNEYYANNSWLKHHSAKVLKGNGINTERNYIWSYSEHRHNGENGATQDYTYTGNPQWQGRQHMLSSTFDNAGKISDSDNNGVDWAASTYNGLQKVTNTWRYLFSGNSTQNVYTIENFTFDHGQRLTNIGYAYGLNGNSASNSMTLSNMEYNYKDLLTEKNIGYVNGRYLQSIDYSYSDRNWLTAINGVNLYDAQFKIRTPGTTGTGGVQNLAASPYIAEALEQTVNTAKFNMRQLTMPIPDNTGANTDLFSENIYYATSETRFQGAKQFNGNIQAVAWQIGDRAAQGYGFSYDNLNRMTDAKYFDLTSTSTSPTTGNTTFSSDFKFNESLSYDVRGNIKTLQRNGWKLAQFNTYQDVAVNYGQIDNLTYTYNPQNQNQITDIYDGALTTKGFMYNGQSNSYTYDANGNLTTDKNKLITGIDYNYLNLPQTIYFQYGRTINFVYDADGIKLRKIVNDGTNITTSDYVNGVEYKNGTTNRINHEEGAVVYLNIGSWGLNNNLYQHEFVLRDHLGNTRVSFRDGTPGSQYNFNYTTYQWELIPLDPGYNDGVITANDITQINNFYPFGLNMEGNWSGAAGSNKYQYNGKELNDDLGLNWSDYGARFYDGAMGRWLTLDPLNTQYKTFSPYAYVADNPILLIDPDGREIVIGAKEGTKAYTQISNSLRIIEKTNPELYKRLQETKSKIVINTGNLNSAEAYKSDFVGRFTNGTTSPTFSSTRILVGQVEKDKIGNVTGAQILRRRTAEEQDAVRTKGGEEAAAKPIPVSFEEADSYVSILNNTVPVTLDDILISDSDKFTEVLGHELGHADFDVQNKIVAWLWGEIGDPNTPNGPGHDPNNPNGNAAKKAEKETKDNLGKAKKAIKEEDKKKKQDGKN